MNTTVWSRKEGFVSVVLFENGTSAAVSTKVFKSAEGAAKFNERIVEVCGHKYELSNLPVRTTNPINGEVTVNFIFENLIAI